MTCIMDTEHFYTTPGKHNNNSASIALIITKHSKDMQ